MQNIDKDPETLRSAIGRQLPTGLGFQFDGFLAALDILEREKDLAGADFIAAILSLWSANERSTKRFNLRSLTGKREDLTVPSSWGTEKNAAVATNIIRDAEVLTVGDRRVDMHQLFSALEVRINPKDPEPSRPEFRFGKPIDIATFHGLITESVFRVAAENVDERRRVKEESILSDTAPRERLTAIADAYLITYTGQGSLTESLLDYYSGKDGQVNSRFTAFARVAGFGDFQNNIFSGNTEEFQKAQLNSIRSAAIQAGLNGPQRNEFERMMREGESGEAMKLYSSAISTVYSKFIDRIGLEVNFELMKPAILSWNRLEPRPRTTNFRRVLRAEIRDALWMLSRQWQMGEFAAEDAGTSVEMRMDTAITSLGNYSLRRSPAHPIDRSTPLEALVEREVVEPDLTLRLEMGRHWLRILQKTLSSDPTPLTPAQISSTVNSFKTNSTLFFRLPVPASQYPAIYADPAMMQWYGVISNGRAIDGGIIYSALKAGSTAESFLTASTAQLSAAVNRAGDVFMSWFNSVYSQPVANETAWDSSHLEYQFHCAAPAVDGSVTVVAADEYASGHMDWYNFDIESSPADYAAGLVTGLPTDTIERRILTLLPGDIQFPGMPKPRWWQFEDYRVDLGGIRADTTEPAKLLLAEFALLYSNDWMLLPFGANVGSICSINSVIVKDVFGQYTRVMAAGAGNELDWQRWSMFNLSRRNYTGRASDTRLFVPPVTVNVMESDPIESVNFLRDEMANMVWGVESIVPDGRGGGREGWDAGQKLYNYLVSITAPPVTTSPVSNDAAIEYQLGTEVPEHWIPFIPVRIDSVTSREIQLRRAAMPRIIPGRPLERVRPQTALLRTGYDAVTDTWNAYNLFEEEVLRSGCIVDRSWQRTRWTDGSVITWLGRRKSTGRGEADSGLEFDVIKTKEIDSSVP